MNEIVSCSACGLLMEDDATADWINCPRCKNLVRKQAYSLEGNLGLAIAAMMMYFPAMLLPIMSFQLGNSSQTDTMYSALYYFYLEGYPLLSILVFLTSMFSPFVQILVSILMYSSLVRQKKPKKMKLYINILVKVRHWVMLDVYVIAILVSTIKLSATAEVIFGPGMVMFVFLMIFSFLLSSRFNKKQIWKVYHHAH